MQKLVFFPVWPAHFIKQVLPVKPRDNLDGCAQL